MESIAKRRERALTIISTLRHATKNMRPPLSLFIEQEYGNDPFLILISCLLSLRAKDTMTLPVSRALFKRARTPEEILAIPVDELEKIIHSIGYFRAKARTLHDVCKELLERFNGKVPRTQPELLSIKGIGIKTANLVLGQCFNVPAICVDIHVHRISNRLGLVETKTAEQTERELQKVLPKKYWIEWNHLLVAWGQNICVPISPKCSECAIYNYCERVGVTRHR